MLKVIRNLLIIVILFGIGTAGIDYVRMTTGNIPLFNISSYKSKERLQSYRGLFYQGSRKVTVSPEEPLVDSSEITFTVLFWDIKVPRSYKEVQEEFTIETKDSSTCTTSKLIYADLDIKVYTYCLDEINIVKDGKSTSLSDYLKSNKSLIEDIDYHLGYTGLYTDNKTLMFKSHDDDNFTNNGLSMFRCNNTNINDVYIGPIDMKFQNDFCTYKDDDFKFIFTIEETPKEETTTEVETEVKKETFYEDSEYYYQFDEVKSDRIFIVVPAIRGKEEVKYPLKQVLNWGSLTLDELKEKGLEFEKVKKETTT